jgi:hypothetical protein
LQDFNHALFIYSCDHDQTLLGDVAAANISHREFYNVWQRFGVLPERYLLDFGMLHPTEKYYPLRPEFAESTFYLYQATKGLLNKKSQNCSHYI